MSPSSAPEQNGLLSQSCCRWGRGAWCPQQNVLNRSSLPLLGLVLKVICTRSVKLNCHVNVRLFLLSQAGVQPSCAAACWTLLGVPSHTACPCRAWALRPACRGWRESPLHSHRRTCRGHTGMIALLQWNYHREPAEDI